MAGNLIASARGLTKSYASGEATTTVLRGIDLDVCAGEFVSVMGPSGSGKSTLLHLLGGLDTPDSGDVLVGGQNLADLSDDERTRLRRNQIGIVYQFFNLIPVLTVAENVALPAVIAGTPEASYRERRDDLLDLVGLADHRDSEPATLSGGQQQRVAIARALFVEPAVLLADEPTGNLDLRSGGEILDLFLRARRELDQTIVMVTHDPRSAAVTDAVLLLRDGLIVDRLDLVARHRPRRAPARVGVPRPQSAEGDPTDPARAVTVLRWLEGQDASGAVRPAVARAVG